MLKVSWDSWMDHLCVDLHVPDLTIALSIVFSPLPSSPLSPLPELSESMTPRRVHRVSLLELMQSPAGDNSAESTAQRFLQHVARHLTGNYGEELSVTQTVSTHLPSLSVLISLPNMLAARVKLFVGLTACTCTCVRTCTCTCTSTYNMYVIQYRYLP